MNDTKNITVFSLDQQQTPIIRKQFIDIFISWSILAKNTFKKILDQSLNGNLKSDLYGQILACINKLLLIRDLI